VPRFSLNGDCARHELRLTRPMAPTRRPVVPAVLVVLAATRCYAGSFGSAVASAASWPASPSSNGAGCAGACHGALRARHDPSAAHRYRASVVFRWQGVPIPGFVGRSGRAPRFETPAACVAAAEHGGALVLDAEEMVERQLRTAPANADMFAFLSDVVLALARYGAAHGIRLADTHDCERILGWMRAEGLTPGDAQYRTLLSVMIADARWDRLGAANEGRNSIGPGVRSEQEPGNVGEARAGVGGAQGYEKAHDDAQQARVNVAPGLHLSHTHTAGRTCCSTWWRGVLRRYRVRAHCLRMRGHPRLCRKPPRLRRHIPRHAGCCDAPCAAPHTLSTHTLSRRQPASHTRAAE